VPEIRPEERETEHDFWTNFEEKRGLLLGVMFDLISGVLRNLRPLDRRPRMADWSDYASALYAHVGWGRKQFQEDWQAEEDRQHETALEGILGTALLNHFKESFEPEAHWRKPVEVLVETPEELLKGCRTHADLDVQRFLPKSASAFMREFNRLIPALQHKGYGIREGTKGKGRESRKVLEIWRVPQPPDGPSPNGSADRSAGSAGSLPLILEKKEKTTVWARKSEEDGVIP
jgi:hypothetical protein